MRRPIRIFSTSLFLAAAAATAQTPPPGMLPYTAILEPQFIPASQATFLLDDDVLLGVHDNVAKAFPAADLAQHGSVNDRMADGPIEVTWCGVCNTGVVFRAEIDGRSLHFEYDSMVGANEVHKDHETGTRWQQSTGEAISGPLNGRRLELYPFVRTTWGEWRRRFPDTLVLAPLPGYDERMANISRRIKAARSGEGTAPEKAFGNDDRLRPKEIVAGLTIGSDMKAYPFSELRRALVVNDRVGRARVLVVHQPLSDTTTAFEARVGGKALQFRANDADASSLVDLETHSTWDAYGLCLGGPLKGTQLKALILVPEFWFAWSEFHPKTEVFNAASPRAQSSAAAPKWERLLQVPLPEDAEPILSVVSLSGPPAPPVQPPIGAGHTHAGPVFAYILEGEIETQIEPDPPAIYRPGDFFYEAPMHVHRFQRNLSKTEPGKVIVFQAGYMGQPPPAIKILLREPLRTTIDQELGLLRLTLPAGTQTEARAHSGPGIVYVVAGKIEILDRTATNAAKSYGAGDVFVEPSDVPGLAFRNATSNEPAQLLWYQASEKQESDTAREIAPAFTLTDSTNREARLTDYRGKVVLLNFWATWCAPCRQEMPWFSELQEKYGSQGLAVLGVSMDDDGWRAIRPYVEKLGVSYRVLLGNEDVAAKYRENALPLTVFVDREGRVAARHVGLTSKSTYEQHVIELLGE